MPEVDIHGDYIPPEKLTQLLGPPGPVRWHPARAAAPLRLADLPAGTREVFDPQVLYARLQARRLTILTDAGRPISWRELSRRVGICSAGIGAQLAAGRQPTLGVLIRLLVWLDGADLDLRPYVRGSGPPRR